MARVVYRMGVLLLAGLLLACNPDRSVKPPPDPVKEQWGLMPLRVGNRWVYEAYDLNPQTGVIDSRYISGDRHRGILRDTVVIIDGVAHDAFVWAKISRTTGRPLGVQWLFSNDAEGVWCMGGLAPTDTLIGRTLEYKYPIQKGESYDVRPLVYNHLEERWLYSEAIRYTCIDDSVWFHTPVDSFLCVAYQQTYEEDGGDYFISWEIIQYFAPNVGEVGMLTVDFSGDRYAPDTTRLNSANWVGRYKWKDMLTDCVILNGE